MAVTRYVQEAILTQPEITASSVASHLLGKDSLTAGETLRDQVRKLVAECIQGHGVLVHNVRTGFAHKPCAGESDVPSDRQTSGFRCAGNGAMAPSTVPLVFLTRRACHPSSQALWTPRSRPTMTTPAPALPVLKDLATDSGLEPKVLQLLTDHGVTNSGSFVHTFQDPAAVKKLLQPTTVGEGVKLSTGTALKMDDVQFLVATSVFARASSCGSGYLNTDYLLGRRGGDHEGPEDSPRQLLGRLPGRVPVRDDWGHSEAVSDPPPVRS